MDAVEALTQLGGIATRAQLRELTSARKIRRAVRDERVLRSTRNRYVLPTAATALRAAARVHGVVSHLGAAAHHGWEIKIQPERPVVSIKRNRKLAKERATSVEVRWTTFADGDVTGAVTSPVRTVLDCARDLPFDEALCVADSALRHGDITKEELVAAAAALKGPGAARARRVAAYADGRAANPLESCLRALAIEEGLDVVVQYEVRAGDLTVHPDIVDVHRGLALEAESWTHHAKEKRDFERDCTRYNVLAISGWLVLRFTWAQVMHSPGYVRWVIREAILRPRPPGRAQPAGNGRLAA